MLEYKGYTGVFDFDPVAERFHGRVIGIRDEVTFRGTSVQQLKQELAEAVEDYLDFCREVGKTPERPYRGRILVRTSPDTHREVAIRAEVEGTSINKWVGEALEKALGAAVPSAVVETGEATPAPTTVPLRSSRMKKRGQRKDQPSGRARKSRPPGE